MYNYLMNSYDSERVVLKQIKVKVIQEISNQAEVLRDEFQRFVLE